MQNIFKGLETMGLSFLGNLNIYDKEEKAEASKNEIIKNEFSEADVLFDKVYTCPVCDKEFKTKMVKSGKVKLKGMDTDLKPIYDNMDPLKYDAIVCPHCGYAALNRYFNTVISMQAKLIKTNISASFIGMDKPEPIYTYDDAINRHKLALINSIIKKAKNSEKAYTCLKTAWILRGKIASLPKETPEYDNVIKELANEELHLIEQAYYGFNQAFSKESFPMCGMDENTVTLLVAELARKIGKKDECSRWVSKLLVARDANERIKEKARNIKELLKENDGVA